MSKSLRKRQSASLIESENYLKAAALVGPASAAVLLDRLEEIRSGEYKEDMHWQSEHERRRLEVAARAEQMARDVREYLFEFSPPPSDPEGPDLARLLRLGAKRLRRFRGRDPKRKPPSVRAWATRRLAETVPAKIRGRYTLISQLLALVGVEYSAQAVRACLASEN